MTDENKDAVAILKRVRAKREPHLSETVRSEAAAALCDRLLEAAQGAGFTVTAKKEIQVSSTFVWFHPDDDGVHFGSKTFGKINGREDAAIEFDAGTGMWVGTEVDRDVALAPGERPPRRSALVALSEAVAKLIEESR